MPAPSPARRSPDLAPAELPLAEALGRLGRARPAAGLREQVLAGVPAAVAVRSVPARGQQPGGLQLGGLRLARLAAAAALLLALSGGLLARSGAPAPAGSRGPAAGRAVAWARATPLVVVDDPTVSLFHGVETFDRLAFEGLGELPR